ncbi:MAG: transcriptional repressor [Phycisphaerae bacterium]|nr:transcriptional repressor [Phycisphaerae bacterium]
MDIRVEKQAIDILKKASLRLTGPRLSILKTLLKADSPLTQEKFAEKLGKNAPDKVTIYRTLETLLEADIVHKAFLKHRTWHYELAHNCSGHQCHPHFTCTNCGETHCMTQITVPLAPKSYKGFLIQHQQVRFDGLCPKCSS